MAITPKAIIEATPPSYLGSNVQLVKKDFDSVVYQHGYDVLVDKAIKCPCITKESGSPLSSCRNCGGKGWVFLNRYKTKLLLQNINSQKKFLEWSEDNMGTVSITSLHEDRLSFMDKITVTGVSSIFNEILQPVLFRNKFFSYLVYEPTNVLEIYLFEDSRKPLMKLTGDNFDIVGNLISFNESVSNRIGFQQDITVSIKYEHNPKYHVIDNPRDSMLVTDRRTESKGKLVYDNMVTFYIGRKAHFVLDAPDFNEGLIDNSYNI